MEANRKTGAEPSSDLVVVSDLHLGEGVQSSEGRYVPNEDFFYDAHFARFLEHLRQRYAGRPGALKLVLNGDTFDFLTVTSVPHDSEASFRHFRVSNFEKKFGLNSSAKKSIYKLDRIAAGHPAFFRALANFIADGFELVVIRGNHDLELYFTEVKERMLEHLVYQDDRLTVETARARVSFYEWFYLEPDRVYIEHGNQYDAGNSIRYPFHPILAMKKTARERDRILDYPLGSNFVRFFYNRVRLLDPYSPRIVSFDHYLSFIKRYNLFDVWKVYKDHYPHFLAALGTAPEIGSAGASEDENARQKTDFGAFAGSRIPEDMITQLSELKPPPAPAGKASVVKEMITAVMRRAFRFSLLAFIAIFLWAGVLQIIDNVPGVTVNAFLTALFAVISLGAMITIWIHLDRKLRRREGITDTSKMPGIAEKIAAIAGVDMVLMGHSHRADYRRIDSGRRFYANSGTWTSVDNPFARFIRDARRMTFLHVVGDAVSLKRWNDDAGRLDDVPLFDFQDNLAMDRLASVSALDITASGDMSLPPDPPYFMEDESAPEAEDESLRN